MGLRSNIPKVGRTRRNGPRKGSVIWLTIAVVAVLVAASFSESIVVVILAVVAVAILRQVGIFVVHLRD